jgi:ribonuclease P protein component
MKPHGMPRRRRLAEAAAIRAVFATGRYHRLGLLQAKTLATGRPDSRYLVSVRKAVGSAPVRNRLKRLVREGVRLGPALPAAHDVCIFVSARQSQPPTLDAIQRDLRHLARRLRSATPAAAISGPAAPVDAPRS